MSMLCQNPLVLLCFWYMSFLADVAGICCSDSSHVFCGGARTSVGLLGVIEGIADGTEIWCRSGLVGFLID